MEQDKIFNEISELPPEAQRQVADFITLLRRRYRRSKQKTETRRINLVDEPFIGMWKDREDMSNSSRWVRNIRETEWSITD